MIEKRTMSQSMFEQISDIWREPEYKKILKFVELFNETNPNYTGTIEFEWFDDEEWKLGGGSRWDYKYKVEVSLKNGLLHSEHSYAFYFKHNDFDHRAYFENGKFSQNAKDSYYNYCIHYELGQDQEYRNYRFDLDFKLIGKEEETCYRGRRGYRK